MLESDKWYGKGKSRIVCENTRGKGMVILNRVSGKGLTEGDIWSKHGFKCII